MFTVLVNIVMCSFSHILVATDTSFYVLVQDVSIPISALLLPDFFLRLDILLLIVSVGYIPADFCNIIAATAFYLGLLIAIFGSGSFIFSYLFSNYIFFYTLRAGRE